ncbi:translation initiation factor IF-2 subunit beta [Halopenitus persicus]|uniref:translation initiation factor IF-2 subunit beta n=1 Tax=Halopenitus persicus TaxID=1048396 RepID=UPI000BBB5098|nr:translation initiation factor IF-2 subunit beta [Halopenitus persicus]
MEYDDKLDRAIEETPDIQREEGRFEVPDPEVREEGHATVFENFQDVVDRLDREPNHVLQFLQGELGTSAGIDERGRARLTGDFRADRIAEAIDDYTAAFVTCPECGLPDTRLVTEEGATLVACDACGARSPTGE